MKVERVVGPPIASHSYDEIRFARLLSGRFEAMQQAVDAPSLRAKCSCDREEPFEGRWNPFSVFQAIGGNSQSQ